MESNEEFGVHVTIGDFSSIYESENAGQAIKDLENSKDETISCPNKYNVVRKIDRGGMGQIFLWKDNYVERVVATKLLRKDKGEISASLRQRFLEESQITGQLEHPNIVPLYEAGIHNNDLYFTMKYINGNPLNDVIKKCKEDSSFRACWSLNKMLQVFRNICHAVEYAHSKNVIHRDLKPQNIMLGKFGETILVDWGLAKVINSGQDVIDQSKSVESLRSHGQMTTIHGNIVGTPAYMSPEQARGRSTDFQSDLYSLGLILYEMITAQKAAHAPNVHSILYKIMNDELAPIPKSGIFGPIHRELASIVRKCLQPEPKQRYSSVSELNNDIQNFLDNKAVEAHHYYIWDKSFKVVSKYRRELFSMAGSFVAAFLVFYFWSSWSIQQKGQQLAHQGHHFLKQLDQNVDQSIDKKAKLAFAGIQKYREAYDVIQCSKCREKLYEFRLYEVQGWEKLFYEAKEAQNKKAMLFAQQRIKHLLHPKDHVKYRKILEFVVN